MKTPKIKKCSRCSEDKSVEDFFRNRVTKDGYKSLCKVCEMEGKTVHYCKERSKDRILRHKYGITLSEYNILLEEQEYKCQICGVHEKHCDRALAVDHNHSTGEIRALLCMACNTGLGMFRENTEFLLEDINYLNTRGESKL